MHRARRLLAGAIALTVPLVGLTANVAVANGSDLLITEYVEGAGFDKALELTNSTDAPIDLGPYVVQVFFNGNTSPSTTIDLAGTVPAGGTWVVGDDGASTALLAHIDQTTTSSLWNGDDAILLRNGGVLIDSFGQVGNDPGSEWFANGVGTANEVLRRIDTVTSGDTVPDDPFDPSAEWDTFPQDDFSDLGDGGGGGEEPDPCDIDPTTIAAVQGSGSSSPLEGDVVVVGGVITDFAGSSGFWLQDPVGDGDPATSEGVFVFTPGGVDVITSGDAVTVCGEVDEFRGLTEIVLDEVEQTGTGTITPMPFSFPAPQWLEAYEGMLLDVDQRLYFTDTFNLGRFDEAFLSGDGPLQIPTDLHAPGSPEAVALAASNANNQVKVDFGSDFLADFIDETGRAVRRGDAFDVGSPVIITETFDDHELFFTDFPAALPTVDSIVQLNDRPDRPDLGSGQTVVASFNVHNYWTSIDLDAWADCADPYGADPGDFLDPDHPAIAACGWEPRGARSPEQLAAQEAQLTDAINALDADVVALQELETPGIGAVNDSDDPNETLIALVDALNEAAGAGTWDYAPLPDGFLDLNTNAIHGGFVYRPSEVSFTGITATDPEAGDIYDRLPVAATFTDGDERFTVVTNHFKSKGCGGSSGDDADQGDGQSCFNATRVAQAEALQDWIATGLRTLVKSPNILALGDLNAYAAEDPIEALQSGGKNAALTDLVDAFGPAEDAYTYTFFGEEGRLDHAFGTRQMADKVTGVGLWHVNADEPDELVYYKSLASDDRHRSSDHDPVLVAFTLD